MPALRIWSPFTNPKLNFFIKPHKYSDRAVSAGDSREAHRNARTRSANTKRDRQTRRQDRGVLSTVQKAKARLEDGKLRSPAQSNTTHTTFSLCLF